MLIKQCGQITAIFLYVNLVKINISYLCTKIHLTHLHVCNKQLVTLFLFPSRYSTFKGLQQMNSAYRYTKYKWVNSFDAHGKEKNLFHF